MTSGVESLAFGIADVVGLPGLAKVGPNFRVLTQTGPIGVVGDTVSFPGIPTLTGNWISGGLRTTINGLPVINQTSTGIGISPISIPTGPIRLQIPDFRVSAA